MKLNDPWAELGLAAGASDTEIKQAYRRLASQWHPDRNPAPEATERMKHINHAYKVLSEGLHVEPDEPGWAGPGPGPFADFFARNFAEQFRHAGSGGGFGRAGAWQSHAPNLWTPVDGAPVPKNIRRKVTITVEEGATGCTRPVSGSIQDLCVHCGGAKQFFNPTYECEECLGDGKVYADTWSNRRVKCRGCRGTGEEHRECTGCGGSGKTAGERTWKLEVRIPVGVRPGDIVTVRGQGQRGASGGDERGDLELEVAFKPHTLFSFNEQHHLQCVVPVDLFKFLVGGLVHVPVLGGGTVSFDLAQGRVQNIPDKGYPGRDGVRGPLSLVARPVFPGRLSDRELLYLRTLASDMAGSGHERCTEVKLWLAEAMAYVNQPLAASCSRKARRRGQRPAV